MNTPHPPQPTPSPEQNDQTPPDRLTVVETIYYQGSQFEPICVESRFSRVLGQGQQPYSRTIQINETWLPIDFGWLAGFPIAIIHVKNKGRAFFKTPTADEIADAERSVVEIGLKIGQTSKDSKTMWDLAADVIIPSMRIAPGEDARFTPVEDTSRVLMVRCARGTTTITQTLFPG